MASSALPVSSWTGRNVEETARPSSLRLRVSDRRPAINAALLESPHSGRTCAQSRLTCPHGGRQPEARTAGSPRQSTNALLSVQGVLPLPGHVATGAPPDGVSQAILPDRTRVTWSVVVLWLTGDKTTCPLESRFPRSVALADIRAIGQGCQDPGIGSTRIPSARPAVVRGCVRVVLCGAPMGAEQYQPRETSGQAHDTERVFDHRRLFCRENLRAAKRSSDTWWLRALSP